MQVWNGAIETSTDFVSSHGESQLRTRLFEIFEAGLKKIICRYFSFDLGAGSSISVSTIKEDPRNLMKIGCEIIYLCREILKTAIHKEPKTIKPRIFLNYQRVIKEDFFHLLMRISKSYGNSMEILWIFFILLVTD